MQTKSIPVIQGYDYTLPPIGEVTITEEIAKLIEGMSARGIDYVLAFTYINKVENDNGDYSRELIQASLIPASLAVKRSE